MFKSHIKNILQIIIKYYYILQRKLLKAVLFNFPGNRNLSENLKKRLRQHSYPFIPVKDFPAETGIHFAQA